MRILVAEDEANISVGYEVALKSRGHEVILTRNGRECVEEYLRNSSQIMNDDSSYSRNAEFTKHGTPFDVVIMDYRMPEMDGIEAAEEILKVRAEQRIIFASAYAKETLIESIQKLHVVAELLQKPFDLRVLIATIENKDIASQLQFLNEEIRNQHSWTVSKEQISELANALLRSKDVKVDLMKIFSQRKNQVNEFSKTRSRRWLNDA